MENNKELKHQLHISELNLLAALRNRHRDRRAKADGAAEAASEDHCTPGQRIADMVANNMGSWRFIIIQSVTLMVWVVLNVTAYVKQWDPYPFILLNLALSFQAAYAAPFIMMSQNRQQDIDRHNAKNDYEINIKAELEIELLHQKIDQLRELEIVTLTKAIAELTQTISNMKGGAAV